MRPEETSEWHTTDLTDHCPARVRLRLIGKISNRAPTAMVRGMAAGAALEFLHDHKVDEWGTERASIEDAINYGLCATRESVESDNRILTDAAEKALDSSIPKEMAPVLEAYVRRLGPIFEKTELIGTEVPIRLHDEGHGVQYASHLDLIVYDRKHGALGCGKGIVVLDWKWRKDSPSKAYLARNQQFLLYWLACRYGKLLLKSPFGEVWQQLDEFPCMAWVHLPSLKPYTRKTVVKNDAGEEIEFKKGDDRPLRQIVRVVRFEETQAENALKSLSKKIEMYRKGFWPCNPDPVGCGICEAEDFCTRFDTVSLEGDE